MREKIQEFVCWYSKFQNVDPIKSFQAYSADYICTNGCKIDILSTRVSVLETLIKKEDVRRILEEETQGTLVKLELDWKQAS